MEAQRPPTPMAIRTDPSVVSIYERGGGRLGGECFDLKALAISVSKQHGKSQGGYTYLIMYIYIYIIVDNGCSGIINIVAYIHVYVDDGCSGIITVVCACNGDDATNAAIHINIYIYVYAQESTPGVYTLQHRVWYLSHPVTFRE